MGVLKKLANINKYETGANYGLGNSLSSASVSSLFGTGGSHINVLEEYSGFAWKCINIQATTLADQDLFIERLVGKKWQKDETHDFNYVLEGGDGIVDQSELLEAHKKSMMLYGESFWYYSMGETFGKPMGIYLLDPASMTVMVTDNRVSGYVYQNNGERIVLDLEEVDHYKIHDPRSRYRGYGPMQAAGWFVRSARYVNTYVNNFLENNAIPAGVVVAKGTVDDDDWTLFKEQWSASHAGINNAGKTGFVRGSDLDFIKTGLSLGEIDFEKIKNTSRDDIMVMFGVSKPMMAIFDDINRASAITARQLFAITNTSPDLRQLTRKLSKKVAKWYGDQFRVGSTNPIPEDEETKLAEYDKGVGRWFTVNEARAAYKLEPIAGGDVIQPALAPPSGASKDIPKSLAGRQIVVRMKSNKAEFNYEMKESFRSELENTQKKYELKFLEAVQPVLKAQLKMVLDQLQPKKAANTQFDTATETQKLSGAVEEIMIALAIEQGNIALAFVTTGDAKFTITPVQEKYIKDSIAKACDSFTNETQDLIAKALTDGLEAGESMAEISDRIKSIYDDVLGTSTPGYRVDRLSRTEVIKTSNEITQAAYKMSGVVEKKEWFSNPGACEYCQQLNGSVISLSAAYVPLGGTLEGVDGGTRSNDYETIEHPPAHPSCRCTIVPVIGEN